MSDIDPSSVLLTDRVAVITGAARGIGRATAEVFCRFGAKVALCDRDRDALAEVERSLPDTANAVVAILDVRDGEAVRQFTDDVRAGFGRVDILVNNAGGTFYAPFEDVSENAEQALIAENFTQATRFMRLLLPMMASGSSIINVTSIEGHQAAPGYAIYAAMKAGLAQLTRTMALELGPRGVRVNAVAVDAVPTGGEQGIRDDMLSRAVLYDTARIPPLGTTGRPDDVAAACVFLASELSRFVTGTTVHVDGGNWAAGAWRLRAAEGD